MSEDWKNTAKAHEARNKLIHEVYYGRMTPDEAEADAKRQGLRPLQEIPDPALFNPMEEPTWTLAMVVAWIVWRTPEVVRENWDDYRLGCWHWITLTRRLPINEGKEFQETTVSELQQSSHATLCLLSFEEALNNQSEAEARKLVSVKSAREELWKRLAEGALMATAIAENSGKPVQVPAHEWPYLKAAASKDLADELRYEQTPMSVEYREAKFRCNDILRLWPPTARRDDPSAIPCIEFEEGQAVFTLFEAAIWVGCEGESLPSETIVRDSLDEKGTTQLFYALSKGKVAATGVNEATKLREPIPAKYWERATCSPGKADGGHYVSLIDTLGADDSGYGGTLTPYGEAKPHWVNIQISGLELRRTFSFKGKQTIAGERACQSWLEGEMRASLNERPKPKSEFKLSGTKQFSISDRAFDRAWSNAVAQVGAIIWATGGRPKKP